eukprot:1384880-Rhodomonas_salina.2
MLFQQYTALLRLGGVAGGRGVSCTALPRGHVPSAAKSKPLKHLPCTLCTSTGRLFGERLLGLHVPADNVLRWVQDCTGASDACVEELLFRLCRFALEGQTDAKLAPVGEPGASGQAAQCREGAQAAAQPALCSPQPLPHPHHALPHHRDDLDPTLFSLSLRADGQVCYAICLCACYAMPGSELAYGAICLCVCYAMSGTDIAYGATRLAISCGRSSLRSPGGRCYPATLLLRRVRY